MGQEIVYTSAPQGLRPGASGFCTVSSTAGMEPNLAEFLEGFSGYPHPYKPPDPRTKENPVNFSHVVWTIGGTRYNILSRVADAGLDYTGRTNLLAHHVALPKREAERCPGGPAWVLASAGFCIDRWDGQLKNLPLKTPNITTEKAPEKCVAWEQAAGDAGYAGVLAEAVKDKGGRPVTIIYPSHLDTLPLLVEAISLLPPEKRWGVTFATFYTRIYSAFECQWRFVFHESAEARAAKRDPHSLVIDLTKGPLPKAEGGDLVTQARTGVRAQAAAPAARAAAVAGPVAPGRPKRPDAPAPLDGDYKLAPPSPGVDLALSPAGHIDPFARSRQNSLAKYLPMAVAFFGCLAVTLVVVIAVLANRQKPPEIVVKPPSPPPVVINDAPSPRPRPKIEEPPPENDPSKIVVAVPETPKPMLPEEAPPELTPMTTVSVTPTAPEPVTPSGPRREYDYFENITAFQNTLPLPPRVKGTGFPTPKTANAKGKWPVKIPGAQAHELVLSLRGVEAAFGDVGKSIKLKDSVDKNGIRQWQVVRETMTRPQIIGTFSFSTKEELSFAWGDAPESAKADSLRMCLLAIEIGGKSGVCRLLEPTIVEPVRFVREKGRLEERNLVVSAPLGYSIERGFNTGDLWLESKLVGAEKFPLTGKQEPLPPGKDQKIFVFEKNPNEGPVARLITRLIYPANPTLDHEVRCQASIGFKPNNDVPVDEVITAIRSPLVLEEVETEIKKEGSRTVVFERELKKLDNEVGRVEEEEGKRIKAIKQAIKEISDKKEELKKDARKAADQQIEQAQKTIQLSEGLIESVKKKRNDKEQDMKRSHALVHQLEALRDFMNHLISECSIEYRVYIKVENEQLDLYRTPGFSAAVER